MDCTSSLSTAGRGQSRLGRLVGSKRTETSAASLGRPWQPLNRWAARRVHKRAIREPAVKTLELFIRLLLQSSTSPEGEGCDLADESVVHGVISGGTVSARRFGSICGSSGAD